MILVTPHLGDAVLHCGELVAAHPGTVVLTVFAGIPSQSFVVPEWDAACGFSSPRQAVSVRRREDRVALELLDAEPCWLACPESQYRRRVTQEEVTRRLARALRRHRAEVVAVPLGLVRGDHAMTFEAAQRLARQTDAEWLVYDDAPLQAPRDEVSLPRFELAADPYRAYLKRRALESYESLARGYFRAGRELRSLAATPERYWRLGR